MTELELLNLARSAGDTITADFSQVITINFAMVVAIYYFLNRASLSLKVFAIIVYGIGMLMYVGVMLEESNVKAAALASLKALPPASLSPVGARYIALNESWLALTTSIFKNLALWVLASGVVYLLFFWKGGVSPKEK